MVTVWSKHAITALKNASEYISRHSPQNAAKVVDEILDITIDLAKHPEMYPRDKYNKENDGKWGAFGQHQYRISYHITPNEIRIVRMRHTSKFPLQY